MMRGFSATLVLVCVLACGVGSAAADDVIRLGGSGSLSDAAAADTVRLDGTFMDDAQVQPVHRWGWGWGGRHHGWGGWGGRGWYGGFYGGYRPYYSSFYRPWGGWGGYYRPYAWGGWGGGWGGYYRPYYSSLFYSSLYYPSYAYSYPSYSYSYAYPVYSFYAPCAADDLVMPEATTLGSGSTAARVQRLPAMPRADEPGEAGESSDGTYDYNGGPQRVVPLPGSKSAPLVAPPPRPMLPRQGKLASLPTSESFAFRAYGEKETTPQQPAVRVTKGAAPALVFPAYGETTGGTTVLTGAR